MCNHATELVAHFKRLGRGKQSAYYKTELKSVILADILHENFQYANNEVPSIYHRDKICLKYCIVPATLNY